MLWVCGDVLDSQEDAMNAHEPSTPVIEPNRGRVTLPEAVNYLANSRGALYSGQLANPHQARLRVSMAELPPCGRVRPCVTS
jgi:hypothetical protein